MSDLQKTSHITTLIDAAFPQFIDWHLEEGCVYYIIFKECFFLGASVKLGKSNLKFYWHYTKSFYCYKLHYYSNNQTMLGIIPSCYICQFTEYEMVVK